MKILITGSNGMLGHDLAEVLKKSHELVLTTSETLDITDEKQAMDVIREADPDVVINSAAYTNVDGCEENPDLAYSVNGEGVRNLALACRQAGCVLLHISTDYIFDGTAREPISEDGEIGPISVYGKSKLKGEEAIIEILDEYFIVRTAWLYGLNGGNFPKTMLELAKSHDEITVVYDEVGTPTYTPDLACAISRLIETDYYGIYHITNSGSCSWCEFSRYIFEIADKDINVIPVTAAEFARPAPRPSYSVLDNRNWIEHGFEPLRNYKEAIKEYIELIKDE
jgi:dTDP-4-dehydrorhamnose reductase